MRIVWLALLFCSAFVTYTAQSCSPTAISVALAKDNALISGAFDQTAVASSLHSDALMQDLTILKLELQEETLQSSLVGSLCTTA
jgi:hypothetical protein